MQSLVLEVSEDRSRLTISAASNPSTRIECDAGAVDALIRRLSACRAGMTPVHPAAPPADSDRVYINDNLLIDVAACADAPAIGIAVQHPGLGWTVTRLAREQAEDLQIAIEFALQDIGETARAA